MVERQANARYPSQLPRRGGCGSTPLHGEPRMPEHLILQTASNNGVRVLKSDLYFGPYGGHCIYFAGKKKPPRALGFCAGMKMSISILVQGPKTPTLCGREEPERGVRAEHCLGKRGKAAKKIITPHPALPLPIEVSLGTFCSFFLFVDWKWAVLPRTLVTEAVESNPHP